MGLQALLFMDIQAVTSCEITAHSSDLACRSFSIDLAFLASTGL